MSINLLFVHVLHYGYSVHLSVRPLPHSDAHISEHFHYQVASLFYLHSITESVFNDDLEHTGTGKCSSNDAVNV